MEKHTEFIRVVNIPANFFIFLSASYTRSEVAHRHEPTQALLVHGIGEVCRQSI